MQKNVNSWIPNVNMEIWNFNMEAYRCPCKWCHIVLTDSVKQHNRSAAEFQKMIKSHTLTLKLLDNEKEPRPKDEMAA